ncbi:caspase domain-containing protein [Streptomyces sp. NPDC002795]|uniref:caspase family protein n=1 Tax=Streptomyces sp. NPDC002795 TaxID=3364665 RepID=UPI0036C64DD9
MTEVVPGEGGGPHRVDPKKSACLLIGVNDYRHETMERLDSVERNLEQLKAVLLDPDIGGFTDDRVRVLGNPVAARQVTAAIEAAGKLAAEDTLIVYYAGHGMRDGEDNRLFLTLPDTERGQPETCVDTKYVRKAISRSPAPRTVLILDCCYSAQWTRDGSMSGGESGGEVAARSVRDLKGLYLMASSPHNRASHAPDPAHCSVFTGALVQVLQQGDSEAGESIRLKDVFDRVRTRVEEWVARQERSDASAPLSMDENGLGEYAFVRNAARRPAPDPPAAPSPPPNRGRTHPGHRHRGRPRARAHRRIRRPVRRAQAGQARPQRGTRSVLTPRGPARPLGRTGQGRGRQRACGGSLRSRSRARRPGAGLRGGRQRRHADLPDRAPLAR